MNAANGQNHLPLAERQPESNDREVRSVIAAASRPAVVLRGVSKSIRNGSVEQDIIRNLNIEINEGEFLAVLGASGSGKTTLLNIIGAMDAPSSGVVEIFGRDIARMNETERTTFRRETLGFIFQFYNLLPTFTALENIRIGLEVLSIDSKEIDERSKRYLRAVGLGDKANRFPSQLSGGEQQRVAIARALARRPRLVVADEPTGNLDRATAKSILELMRELHRESGTTFIIVTHDAEVTQYTDRTYRMDPQSI